MFHLFRRQRYSSLVPEALVSPQAPEGPHVDELVPPQDDEADEPESSKADEVVSQGHLRFLTLMSQCHIGYLEEALYSCHNCL